MLYALIQLALFTAKAIIIVLLALVLLVGIVAILSKGKQKSKGRLIIKNLNNKYEEMKETILTETLSQKQFKKFLKEKKAALKAKTKLDKPQKNIYVLNFQGDMRASTVTNLSEEVTAILNVATSKDEVVVRLESPGGVVHGYGLAAAQLMRLRARKIPLTIAVDKVAASGGYMMAAIGNKILAAPFAIIGSIGVIVQLPNFHRVLQDKHIDFEQLTAGDFKRTLTVFGKNTEEGRKKLQSEIEDIQGLFKNLITEHRHQVDIKKIATGEHWLGEQALQLKLVDEIKTSDDYLLEQSARAHLYEICYEVKKPLLSRFSAGARAIRERLLGYGF